MGLHDLVLSGIPEQNGLVKTELYLHKHLTLNFKHI